MSSATATRSDRHDHRSAQRAAIPLLLAHVPTQLPWNMWPHAGTSLHSLPRRNVSRQMAHTSVISGTLPPRPYSLHRVREARQRRRRWPHWWYCRRQRSSLPLLGGLLCLLGDREGAADDCYY